jgi:hypothetical protein
LLMTAYQLVGEPPGDALQAALFTALGVLAVAMVMAVRDLRVTSGSVLPS